MSELVKLTFDGEIAIVTIDNPPVNALSPGVPEAIGFALEEIAGSDEIKGAVLIGAGATFIAGADIREFGKIRNQTRDAGSPILPLISMMEDLPKPIVAAIHGTAFGGGLEIAQGAHFRVADAKSLLGQPEVKLGLIPGAGGTQRLPRLVGVSKAVEMCAFGEPISAKEALENGLIDKIAENDLLAEATEFVREVIQANKPSRKTRELKDKIGDETTNSQIFETARATAKKIKRGLSAPLKAIDAVEAATRIAFDEGIKFENKLFVECLQSTESKALIHVFFGEREVAKIPDVPKDTPVLPIEKAAVIGAGTMGGGIAMNFANAGIPVVLKETTEDALTRGMATIEKNYASSVKKGRMTEEAMQKRLSLITPTLSYDSFADADVIVEAAFENMALKREIFGELDKICKPSAILASNTSTLSIDEIAHATSRPEMVIGHHYFSPANVMRLLEIVRGEKTSKEVVATSMKLAKLLRKLGVLVGNCPGFVANRMLEPYGREAQFLVEEGATVEQVDSALNRFGMPMGLFAMSDLAGVDVGWRIRQEYKHLEIAGRRYPVIADKIYELGRYGQKTKAGWYDYDENRKPAPNAEIARMLKDSATKAGIEQREVSDDEVIERMIYASVNEGARILEEGVALRSVDIDLIYINGFGFPVWRGGPMFYADTIGLDKVYARVKQFHEAHGDWWKPANLLKELAETGKNFGDFDRKDLTAATAESAVN
jgi:3-hydroxyacyl-CoA dehydrogenase